MRADLREEAPVTNWLADRLTHKTLVALVALAVLNCVLAGAFFLSYLERYVDRAYDGAIEQANEEAVQAAGFFEGCAGERTAMEAYLNEQEIYCIVQREDGSIYYESVNFGNRGRLAVSGAAEVQLPDGETGILRVWEQQDIERGELSQSVRSSALLGLSALSICVFLLVAVVMYLLVLSPIIHLRKTIRSYYAQGEKPRRSDRRDEIGRLQNAFADMVEVVEVKEKAERQLIASISHDVKTPLTSILGYSERLRSAELDEEKQRQYVERIYEKGLRLKAVVDEFDQYLDVGLRGTAPMTLTTAGELCGQLKAEYSDELSDAGADFAVACTCPEVQLVCNWEHIRRLFGNLIGNAFQHGGAQHLALRLTCEREDSRVVFLFSDNGRGVPEGELAQIFEPLYTSDPGRKVSGLGLSICRSIVRAHGGTISAENLPGGGLQLRIALPVVEI